MKIFASQTPEAIRVDPAPYIDRPTGRRLARPVSLLQSTYSPRPEYQVKQKNPANRVLDALRPAVFARELDGRAVSVQDIVKVVGTVQVQIGATPDEGEHAARVLGKLARFDS